MKAQGDDISKRLKNAVAELAELRSLHETERKGEMEVSLSCHPVDPMDVEIGEWTDTPFPGVTIFGVRASATEVVVVCQVEQAARFAPHHHGEWSEELVLSEGELYEHTTGLTYGPGSGLYFQPAQRIHEPEFLTPGRCMITWRRKKTLFVTH